jgi:hypothetical protein
MANNKKPKYKNRLVENRISIFDIDYKTPAKILLEKAKNQEKQKKITHKWQTSTDGKTKKYVRII